MGVVFRIENLKLENGELVKEIGMIFNKETVVTDRIHVCSVGIAPCDDPEDQMVVSEEIH